MEETYTDYEIVKAALKAQDDRTVSPDVNQMVGELTGWIVWLGGECPVEGDARVAVMFRDGNYGLDIARLWDWGRRLMNDDIFAYLILPPDVDR